MGPDLLRLFEMNGLVGLPLKALDGVIWSQ